MRIAAGLVVVVACSGGSSPPAPPPTPPAQSFHDGVEVLCSLPEHVPEPEAPFEQRLAALGRWADTAITNPEARRIGTVESLAANRQALADAVAKAGVAHCLLLDNGMELQSFADGMTAVCSPDATSPAYFKSHLLNREVVTMMGAIGDLNPAERMQRMRDAIARAGLTRCALVDRAETLPADAPTAPDVGLVALDPGSPVVVITDHGIVIEGKAIVAVDHGDVDASEKEGGALGLAIPRLRTFVQALAKARPGPPLDAVTLVVAPQTPYRLLIEVMFSIKSTGVTRFALAVRAGATPKAIPILIPEKAAPGAKPTLGMVVALASHGWILWSISGQEGTLQKPVTVIPKDQVDGLRKPLAEIVERRWHGGTRGDRDLEIIVMADGTTTVQELAAVLATVRTTADGQPLFPHPLLSTGFQ